MSDRCLTVLDHILREQTPARAGVYIEQLIKALPDKPELSEQLDIDLDDTVRLMRSCHHNNDEWHRGESVLDHTINVLEDITDVCESYCWDDTQKRVLFMVGLLHDVGKAFTYGIDPDGRRTFYKHQEVSTSIAELLLWCLRDAHPEEYKRIIETIRLHDMTQQLVVARAQSRGSTRYLNRVMREWIYLAGHLDDVLLFTKADMARAKIRRDLFTKLESVMADLRCVEDERRQEERMRASRKSPTQATIAGVQAILEVHAPGLVKLLPDVREVKRVLGKAHMHSVLRLVQEKERDASHG